MNNNNNQNKIEINVPVGIRFLSDWEDFRLANFPNKCIINKQIPGCGFTEYCINSLENIILCSPRKLLLKNKKDQHESEVYLIVNEMDKDPGVDKDLTRESKDHSKEESKEEIEKKKKEAEIKRSEIYKRLYSEIEEYSMYCFIKQRPMKILVTYDSYHIAVDILSRLNCFNRFYTVIDEFQSILHDSRFKSDTELGFLNVLQQSHSAVFVSATPMMDDYIAMLDEFKDLPYYELNWGALDPTRIIKPDLDVYLMRSVGEKAAEVIQPYLEGNFDSVVVMRDGVPTRVVSDELVIYVNSVNHIISIIKKLNLLPEQVNILCADTEENCRRIKRRLGAKFDIGTVPGKGIKPKMFTFCTRTVYLGIDFYSLCAQSAIFSDSNSDCLAVDISEDLPQILGRQRLEENPWKNSAKFYYRTTADYRKMNGEDFERVINQKRKSTESLLRSFDNAFDYDKEELAKNYKDLASLKNYKDNYVAVNKVKDVKTGKLYLKPVLNNLVMVNEIRAFKIQQIDYKDRFTVFTTIHNQLTPDDIYNKEASNFIKIYDSYNTRLEKLRLLCEYGLSSEALKIVLSQIVDSDDVKSFYNTIGPQRLKELGYNVTKIKKELGIVTFSPELLKQEIYSNFKEGSKYTLLTLKNQLTSIYSSINYNATPKAKDIENWFEVKPVKIYNVDPETGEKKQYKGYELLKIKKQ